MADDTRQPPSTSPPDSVQRYNGKTYEVFNVSPTGKPITPPENANALAGANVNTAGGKEQLRDVSLLEEIKNIKWEDLAKVHQLPCARDSFLTGIGSGFAVGGLNIVFGRPVPKAANWAAGTFMAGSFLMYQFCQRRRQMERDGMKRAIEIMDKKRTDREQRMQEKREARRREKEEADRLEEQRRKAEEEEKKRKSSWQFW